MKILIIQTAFLGDLILTTGFIRRVREKYPNAEISILVNKGSESILTGNPFLKEIIPFDKKQIKKSIFGFFKFAWEIRRKKFQLCLTPHFSHRSSILAFLSGAKQRIGYKQAGFSFLLTDTKHRPLLGSHEINKLFSILDEQQNPYKPELYFLDAELIRIKTELENKLLFEKPYIVVAPSSIWETKRMPEDKFHSVIESILLKTNFRVLVVGSSADKELSDRVLQGFKERTFNFTGETNLKELCFIISQSKAVLSNDSSPIHIASAFNIPTLAIFGATIPDFGYTPLSEKQFISEVRGLECRPCGIHGGNKCPVLHFRCMREQNPSLIFENLMKLLH
jgi:heptosyltransferase II